MTPLRTSERGEGKIGCVLTLLVLITIAAVATKVVPVYYSDNELTDTAKDLASKAGIMSVPTLELQLRDRARTLEIPEALAPGAMKITTMGERSAGTCVVNLKYARKVDLFGVYVLTIDTEKVITRPYMDAR